MGATSSGITGRLFSRGVTPERTPGFLGINDAADPSSRMCLADRKTGTEKELDRLPTSVFDRVVEAILQLESEPRPHGSQKLRGTEAYRVRVGSYRVLDTVDDGLRIVEVFSVGHRRDVYR